MKALVLSGGSGTRMRPMTHTSAKQLLPVGNKPVLFLALESIAAAGLADVGIVIGDTGPQVMRAVGDGSDFGLNVTYLHQPEPLGLAHAVLIARDWLGDDDFLMYLGDNFLSGGITRFVSDFRACRPDAQVMLTRVPDPRSFGVAELDGSGAITALVEKPQVPKSDLALAGVYLFTPVIHDAVSKICPSWRGELEITDAVQWLVDAGYKVGHQIVTGEWKDTGSVTDMLAVNRVVLDELTSRIDGDVDSASEIRGRVEITAGARVRNSTIIGPAIITSGAEISGSYVGPFTSIGENCQISRSEIESSIVLPDTRIDGVLRVENSFIGREVEITASAAAPGVYQLVLGDHCRMRLG
ncbi:MAG TPA: glucose-1-phosphate thymidylyltransferase [Streptosporangiaceae bacterium]|nr:glucose-1-phosphate thymidylyltransferase [Streptosporangiaceae bacterium]